MDCVAHPTCHEHVAALVAFARDFQKQPGSGSGGGGGSVVLVPFGGGTTVTQALCVPKAERRTVVSVDMRAMN